MAKIALSEEGYWLGKELYKGQKYMSRGNTYFNHSKKDVLKVTISDLSQDIERMLNVTISLNTNDNLVKLLARELCHKKYGCKYCIDPKAKFGVQKIVNPPPEFDTTTI